MNPDHRSPNRYWGAQAPPTSKADFFNAITGPPSADGGTVATIRLFGPIDSWGGIWGVSTADLGDVLDGLPETVTSIVLRINSPGGEVFEAVSMLNMLRAHKAPVTAVVDGLAASAASVIAAGCAETIMSPGTQMMVHAPLVFSHGNAVELRKAADVLDGIQESIVEIYRGKAGDADWAALLAAETWYTATEAVAQGLADRVAVVPDTGLASTVGADDPDDADHAAGADPENTARRRPVSARTHPTLILPASTEPGIPNRKETAVAHSDLTAGIRERLGVTDVAASDETLLAALDEALAEQADPTPALPQGAIAIDADAHQALQRDAAAGRQALDTLNAQRRDGVVDAALREGRITAASRDKWRAQLDKDEDGITTLLASFPTNTVPVTEIGHADTLTDAEDALYATAWGTDEKGL